MVEIYTIITIFLQVYYTVINLKRWDYCSVFLTYLCILGSKSLAIRSTTIAPPTAMAIDWRLNPVTPSPKIIFERKPPAKAPIIPSSTAPKIPPLAGLGSTMFTITPTMRPNSIQVRISISFTPFQTGQKLAFLSRRFFLCCFCKGEYPVQPFAVILIC